MLLSVALMKETSKKKPDFAGFSPLTCFRYLALNFMEIQLILFKMCTVEGRHFILPDNSSFSQSIQ